MFLKRYLSYAPLNSKTEKISFIQNSTHNLCQKHKSQSPLHPQDIYDHQQMHIASILQHSHMMKCKELLKLQTQPLFDISLFDYKKLVCKIKNGDHYYHLMSHLFTRVLHYEVRGHQYRCINTSYKYFHFFQESTIDGVL